MTNGQIQTEQRQAQLSEIQETHNRHLSIIDTSRTFVKAREVQAEVLSQCDSLDPILLIGCGDGTEAEVIFHHVGVDPNALRVYAVDINVDRLRIFESRFKNATCFDHDISFGHLPKGDEWTGQMRVVQMGFVYHDQTEAGREELLRNCFRVLQPNGLLLLAEIIMDYVPNQPPIPSLQAETRLNQELGEYYQPYLDELAQLEGFSEREKAIFTESINRAWSQALLHQDGRENFETQDSLRTRLTDAGFVGISYHHAFNKGWVVEAHKTTLSSGTP